MKIDDYCIVESFDLTEFNDTVCMAISNDWQPFGNLQVVYVPHRNAHSLLQAMVKYENDL